MAAGDKLKFLYITETGGTATLRQATAEERVDGHVHERDYQQGGTQQAGTVLVGDHNSTPADNPAGDAEIGTAHINLGVVSFARMLLKPNGTAGITPPVAAAEGTVIDDFLNQQRSDPSTPGKLDEWLGGPLADGTDGFIRPGSDVTFTFDYGATDPHILINSTAAGGTGGAVDGANALGGDANVIDTVSGGATLDVRGISGTANQIIATENANEVTLSLHGDVTGLVSAHEGTHDHTDLHEQNADTALDSGAAPGPNAVTAAEIVTHMGGTGARLHSAGTYFQRDWTIETPQIGDVFPLFRTEVAITVSELGSMTLGTGSATFDIYHNTTTMAASTNGLTGGTVRTVNDGGNLFPVGVTSFVSTNNEIPLGSMIWVTVTAISSTPTQLYIDLQWLET